MSGIGARVEFRLRSLAARAAAAFGTAPVSLALLVLALAHATGAEVWGRLGSAEAAEAFATSWSAWLLAAAICLDALVRSLRLLPGVVPGLFSTGGPPPKGRRLLAAMAPLVIAAGWLLVGLALAASLALKDRFTLSLGAGERFEGRPGQVVSRAPPRPMSPGPKPLDFTVRQVSPGFDEHRDLRSLDARIELDGSPKATSAWDPVWLGGGRFLRLTGYGYAPRFELRDPAGRVLDGAFVKLDLLPPGRTDEIRSEVMPHRFYLRLVPARTEAGARALELEVEAFRGRLPMTTRSIHLGEPLVFEGFSFVVPEVNYLARFEVVDDPGILLLLLAGLVGLLGLAVGAMGRSGGR